MPFSKYSQYPVVSRISAKGIKITIGKFTFLMPFSKCSQYPVVGRISANGIKNLFLQTIKYYHAFGLERVFRIPNKVVKIVKKTS